MSDAYERGMEVRREVLGDEHVDARDRADDATFTADFQDLITRYAWGEIWARPGPRPAHAQLHHAHRARRARAASTSSRMHVRAALRTGSTRRRDQGGAPPDARSTAASRRRTAPSRSPRRSLEETRRELDGPDATRRSGSSAPARPGSRSRSCSTARASSRSCSRTAAATTSSTGSAPACSSRATVDLLAEAGVGERHAARRASSTTGSSSSSTASGTGSPFDELTGGRRSSSTARPRS